MALGKCFLRDSVGSPEGQGSAILPTRVANHSAGNYWFILHAHGAGYIIINNYSTSTRGYEIIDNQRGA